MARIVTTVYTLPKSYLKSVLKKGFEDNVITEYYDCRPSKVERIQDQLPMTHVLIIDDEIRND